MIRFDCDDCGKKIKVADKHAGKKGKCPNCGSGVVVPPGTEENVLETLKVKEPEVFFNCTICDEPLVSVESKREKLIECKHCGSFAEVPLKEVAKKPEIESYDIEDQPQEKLNDYVSKSEQVDDGYSGVRKLPWFVDMFLYPFSGPGTFNFLMFVLGPFVISILSALIIPAACFLWLLRILIGWYFCWYLAECVRDSGMGGVRAPSVLSSGTDDFGSLFFAWFNLLLCFLICFLPAFIYAAVSTPEKAEFQPDMIFWGLIAYAAFLLPVLFLSVAIIDSISSWNPVTIIVALVKLQPEYTIFSAVFFMFLVGLYYLPDGENVSNLLLSRPVTVYVTIIGAHLLGRVYWKNAARLDW